MTVSGLAEFCDVLVALEFATGVGPALSQATNISADRKSAKYFILFSLWSPTIAVVKTTGLTVVLFSIEIRPCLNDIKPSSHYAPFDVLLHLAAEDAFDMICGGNELPNDRVAQYAAAAVKWHFL